MSFTVVDIILLSPLLFGLVKGAIKGLVAELSSIIGLIAGLLLAFNFSGAVFNRIAPYFSNPAAQVKALAFALVFIGVIVGVALVSKIVTRALTFAALGPLNRLLGAAFGFFKWLLFTTLAVYFFAKLQSQALLVQPALLNHSLIYPMMLELSTCFPDLWESVKAYNPQQQVTLIEG